jgi:hypothetical protein
VLWQHSVTFPRNEQANSYILVEKNLSAYKLRVLPHVRKAHGLTVPFEYETTKSPTYGG